MEDFDDGEREQCSGRQEEGIWGRPVTAGVVERPR